MKSRHTVAAFNADDDNMLKRWALYRCLQGSVESGGNRYTLSDGKWYHVADNFQTQIQATFDNCRSNVSDTELPVSLINTITDANGKQKKVAETEGEYNQRASHIIGAIYLDKETGSVAGIAGQRNELCDILIESGLRLVHIKRGSRSSGSLHHLFRQGATAARMLRDPRFLASIGTALRAQGRQQDAETIEGLSAENCVIEFRIIDTERQGGDFDIPFFAKVALHYAAREILQTGCTARLGFIPYEEAQPNV